MHYRGNLLCNVVVSLERHPVGVGGDRLVGCRHVLSTISVKRRQKIVDDLCRHNRWAACRLCCCLVPELELCVALGGLDPRLAACREERRDKNTQQSLDLSVTDSPT